MSNDDWESFDWETWGAEGSPDGASAGQGSASSNGHTRVERPLHYDLDERDGDEGAGADAGRWESRGGILRWEAEGADGDEATDPRAEAVSPWAADEFELPPGAPDSYRIRATNAWLLRQRALENEALGALLLERRRLRAGDDEGEAAEPERDDEPFSPLGLALTEHQAALETYERTLEALAEIVSHTGPAKALVEFYLWLNERLAQLATMPEAPADFAERVLLMQPDASSAGADTGEVTPTTRAEWTGCAEALLHTRKRIEQVSVPDPED